MKLLSAIVVSLCLLGCAAEQEADRARADLIAAKTAMYDANFRNDRAGLRAAVDRALAAANVAAVKAMALYYAAWGEWALSHSELQAGEIESARATLRRAEQSARAAFALRPDDPEFVVMLADVLIWQLVADSQRFSTLAPEVRTLRARALELRPDNPRAMIMDAGMIFNTPPERGGDRDKGLAMWKRAITLFEEEAAERSPDPLRPDWGLALSYAWICDLYLAMRPPRLEEADASARKALQMRPDFWYVNDVVMPRLRGRSTPPS